MHPSEPVLERGAHLALAASSLPVLEPAQSSGTGNCGANLPGRVTTVPRPITLTTTSRAHFVRRHRCRSLVRESSPTGRRRPFGSTLPFSYIIHYAGILEIRIHQDPNPP
ncbi:hypothetical protein VUR80DRAFT_4503 [Thermomyces stellatus]